MGPRHFALRTHAWLLTLPSQKDLANLQQDLKPADQILIAYLQGRSSIGQGHFVVQAWGPVVYWWDIESSLDVEILQID